MLSVLSVHCWCSLQRWERGATADGPGALAGLLFGCSLFFFLLLPCVRDELAIPLLFFIIINWHFVLQFFSYCLSITLFTFYTFLVYSRCLFLHLLIMLNTQQSYMAETYNDVIWKVVRHSAHRCAFKSFRRSYPASVRRVSSIVIVHRRLRCARGGVVMVFLVSSVSLPWIRLRLLPSARNSFVVCGCPLTVANAPLPISRPRHSLISFSRMNFTPSSSIFVCLVLYLYLPLSSILYLGLSNLLGLLVVSLLRRASSIGVLLLISSVVLFIALTGYFSSVDLIALFVFVVLGRTLIGVVLFYLL